MVFLGRNPGATKASEVVVDDYSKVFFLLDRVIRSGRSRIVHITGDGRSDYFDTIRHAYADALARFGIAYDPCKVIAAKPTFEGGMSAVDMIRGRGLGLGGGSAGPSLRPPGRGTLCCNSG